MIRAKSWFVCEITLFFATDKQKSRRKQESHLLFMYFCSPKAPFLRRLAPKSGSHHFPFFNPDMFDKRTIRWALLAVAATLCFATIYAVLAPLTGKDSRLLHIDRDDTSDSLHLKVSTSSQWPQRWALRAMIGLSNYGASLHVGQYEMGNNSSALSVFRHLRNGSQTPVRLTVPLVRRSEDLARFLGKSFCDSSDDFARTLTDTALLAQYEKTPATAICLFIPNTYEIYWDKTPQQVLERMYREYRAFWTAKRLAQAEAQGLSPDEVITMASIVEQETQYTPERPDVAGMYLNRFRQNMPLQADPTVKFALQDFQLRRILHKHLTVDSPYNTYRYRGLPPGPICIPSISSIEAVLNARRHNYLFMCAKEDFSGSHNFASTYAEHMKNARKYTQALDQRGIR